MTGRQEARTPRTHFRRTMHELAAQARACRDWADTEVKTARSVGDVMPEDDPLFWTTAQDEVQRMLKALNELHEVTVQERIRTAAGRGL